MQNDFCMSKKLLASSNTDMINLFSQNNDEYIPFKIIKYLQDTAIAFLEKLSEM